VPFATVCISREAGADGELVGRLVAEALGYRYLDEEIVARAAERGALDTVAVAGAETRPSLRQRLTDALAEGASSAPEAVAFSGVLDPGYSDPGERVRGLIRDAIAEMAALGDVVIVAHAASYTLGRDAGALRVLVTASPETRAGRLAGGSAPPEKAVRDADRARAHYLKSFYDVSQELPTHYDLVVNTDSLTAAQAAGVITALAQAD
jgi:hypothetical protein